jgi:hypothetical protein
MSMQILDNRELERVLSAAAVSETFRRLLLVDPVRALTEGYQGERFHVDAGCHRYLSSLRVTTLSEFAQRLLRNPMEQEVAAQCGD